jgi:hypothetical protein
MIDDYKCCRPYVRSSIAHCWKHIIVSTMKIYTNFPIVYTKTAVHSDQRCCFLIPECSWTSNLSVQTVFLILCTETCAPERLWCSLQLPHRFSNCTLFWVSSLPLSRSYPRKSLLDVNIALALWYVDYSIIKSKYTHLYLQILLISNRILYKQLKSL